MNVYKIESPWGNKLIMAKSKISALRLLKRVHNVQDFMMINENCVEVVTKAGRKKQRRVCTTNYSI